ncbi:MAG: glycogen debranching protein GlgX [Anaerolineae bacterium]
MTTITPGPGHPLPLGATIYNDHVRFAIFSRHATRVWLMLFDAPNADAPCREFELHPDLNRTGEIWHIDLRGIGEGQLYLYRMDGPYNPEEGHRFNPNKGLLDPYARALSGSFNSDRARAIYGYERQSPREDLSFSRRQNFAHLPKCIVVSDEFDWQGDRPLNRPLRHTIIYEAHTRGLSAHPSAMVKHPGTYRGVIELIPHFLELGVTAIELLPIQACDRGLGGRVNPITGAVLTNYWGYNPVNFFAVEQSYSHNPRPGQQLVEFKTMVKELHRAGLEVILDVVYNHTAEGNHVGPTISFRGIDNPIYYLLKEDKRFYKNYSGTGNTFNCNHPVVRDLILDSLRYWVVECHVDGFRFDLASILGRDQRGRLLENPPIVERIAEDPILRKTKIIAEAWDAAGAYQVGSFPGGRWAEWNGRYRDDVRRFWRGEATMVSALATRLAGSSDLYLRDGRAPFHSINFITSHDGFTLNDLVSYTQKHNLANGEDNRDGDNANFSDNLGVEGTTGDPAIERRRIQRIKNFLATLMLSQGVPMLLAGDEFRRTQGGNNNAYPHDNEISWLDWSFKKRHAEIFNFTRQVIAFRKRHPIFYRAHFFTGDSDSVFDIEWFSETGGPPDWDSSPTLAVLIHGRQEPGDDPHACNDALLMFNNQPQARRFRLPPAPDGKRWLQAIDTAQPPPFDIRPGGQELALPGQSTYLINRESMAVLLSF